MISVTDLHAGTTFEDQGRMYQVLSYEHIKTGRGSANIRVKVRDLKSGSVIDKSYINGAKVQDIYLVKRDLQFLYKDESAAYFMDPQSFEQLQIPISKIPEHVFLKDGESFSVTFLDEEALSVLFPPKMEFAISQTGPSVKGNSATNVFKDAILENGMVTKVPLFINTGDHIRVDTRTGAYCERA
ncbi:MAG: elongation factor P [Candidatus Levybacteria bacterium]|nr:elongation factor P [Candidatus Levybacteria bacterium]